MKKYLHSYLLLAVLLMAAGLSWLHLDARSLWLDEGISFYNSGAGSISAVTGRVAALDLSPPAYYYLMHFWQSFSGTDTAMFRALSVLFFLLNVWLTYALGREILNKKTGLLAAFLLATNPFFIGFSQEARMYMMLTFLILSALYSLLKILSKTDNAKWWLIFTLANTVGLFTHNFYFFVGFALAMCLLLFLGLTNKRGQTIGAALVSALVTLILYLPWLPSLLQQLKVERYWIKALEWRDVKNWLIDFAGGHEVAFYLLAMLGIVGVYYASGLAKKEEFKEKVFRFFVIFVFGFIAFAVPALYSFIESPLAKSRYFLFVIPLISVAAALGVYSLKKIHRLLIFVPLLFFIWIWQPRQLSGYPIEMNEDFRAVADYIESGGGDIPVIVHTPSAVHVMSFYNQENNLIAFPGTFDLRHYNIFEEDGEIFNETVKDLNDFWLLITHTHENPQGILRRWSEEKCPQLEEKDFGPIFLARYTCGK